MTDGIDIHLTRLIEAVNSPDWWAIGITVVNALIMVWLGVKQYRLQQQQTYIQEYQTKLQERQTKHQEYEIYRDLYKTISDVQIEIFYFLFMSVCQQCHQKKMVFICLVTR